MKKTKIIVGLFKLLLPLLHIMCATVLLGVLGYVCAAAVTVTGIMMILSIMGLFDASISALAAIMICAAVLRGAARYTEQKSGHYIAFRELALIRDKVYGALRKLAPAKLEQRGKGDLCSMVTSDIEQLEVFYAHTVAPVAIAVIMSSAAVIFMAHYSVSGAIIAAIAYITVGAVIPLLTSKIGEKSGKASRKKLGELNNIFLENLRGIEISMQLGNSEKRRVCTEEKTKELLECQRVIKKHEGIAASLTGASVIIFTAFCLIYELYTTNDFASSLISAAVMSSSFGSTIALSNLSSTLVQTFASAERVLKLLEEKPAVEEIENGAEPFFEGAALSEVSFGYGTEAVLCGFELDVKKGGITGLMGKSGCGKSTVLRLLMRFWKCTGGSVRISDIDINGIKTSHLKKLEGFMTQTTDLFRGTVRENIQIGKINASEEEVVKACEKASVHEFIMSLPNGYDTEVGELGGTLSAGERQRIGLARAFLHDAPLLLLDEPTANLDALNEGAVLRAISQTEGKTVVISSHRKSTLGICDEIFDFYMMKK